MATGRIKAVNDRGFGFIKPDQGDRDIFVHFRSFEDVGLPHPEIGDRLAFEIEESERGLRAIKLKSLN